MERINRRRMLEGNGLRSAIFMPTQTPTATETSKAPEPIEVAVDVVIPENLILAGRELVLRVRFVPEIRPTEVPSVTTTPERTPGMPMSMAEYYDSLRP